MSETLADVTLETLDFKNTRGRAPGPMCKESFRQVRAAKTSIKAGSCTNTKEPTKRHCHKDIPRPG